MSNFTSEDQKYTTWKSKPPYSLMGPPDSFTGATKVEYFSFNLSHIRVPI